MVLERQLHGDRVRFTRADRAWLAVLLRPLPRDVLRHLRLLVGPDTVLRWHLDLIVRRHARRFRPHRVGRPRTVRSIRRLVLRLASENGTWGYRRIHGELLVLGVKVAASTVWEILKDARFEPAPERTSSKWAAFLRSRVATGPSPARAAELTRRLLDRTPGPRPVVDPTDARRRLGIVIRAPARARPGHGIAWADEC
jgi:hypothetical protein